MKAFIFEGYLQHGGAYMAYHIGRICYEKLGIPVVIVGSPRPSSCYFNYLYDFPVVSVSEMEQQLTAEDVLICNPSFSYHMFGLRLPGKKLCYVQGMKTFSVLDAFFDTYIFVSQFVKEFVQKYYSITGKVINAFIDTKTFNGGDIWDKRQRSVMLLNHKVSQPIFEKFEKIYRDKYPSSDLVFERYEGLTQTQLSQFYGSHKYYLSLAVLEGFDLPMLEAMASGCTVVAFDSGGSREYTLHNYNALVASYPYLELLAEYLFQISQDSQRAKELAKNAYTTSRKFHLQKFEAQWITVLKNFLS